MRIREQQKEVARQLYRIWRTALIIGSVSLLVAGGAQIRSFSEFGEASSLLRGLALLVVSAGCIALRATVFRTERLPEGPGTVGNGSEATPREQ